MKRIGKVVFPEWNQVHSNGTHQVRVASDCVGDKGKKAGEVSPLDYGGCCARLRGLRFSPDRACVAEADYDWRGSCY